MKNTPVICGPWWNAHMCTCTENTAESCTGAEQDIAAFVFFASERLFAFEENYVDVASALRNSELSN